MLPLAIFLSALVIAGGVAVWIIVGGHRISQSSTPLSLITPINLKVSPSTSGGCNVTFDFIASVQTRGAGTVVYQWERHDGTAPIERTIPVTTDDGSFRADSLWKFNGSQDLPATVTFHLLKPDDLKASATITDKCSSRPRQKD